MKKRTRKYAITFTQPTLAQQHSRDEVNINNIMARYQKTGVIDHVAKFQPQYQDNNHHDYHESMNTIIKADEMFSELPSSVRKHFHNDPAQFLEFVSDSENHTAEKLSSVGLVDAPLPVTTPASTPETKTEPASE